MEICSIGFTKKTAEQFFGLLKQARVELLLDVRLHNVSQLAGYSKRDDLRYFLREICNADYRHEPQLAPSAGMLDAYKKDKGGWDTYAARFLALMTERRIEETLPRTLFARRTALLCSEPTAEFCHRRLVLEYLQEKWGDLDIRHL